MKEGLTYNKRASFEYDVPYLPSEISIPRLCNSLFFAFSIQSSQCSLSIISTTINQHIQNLFQK